MSKGSGFAFNIGVCADPGSLTSFQVDSAFVFETSGDAFCLRFESLEDQTTALLKWYVWCSAVTGTPTFDVEARNGPQGTDDPDRPEAGGSTIATSTGYSPTSGAWLTITISSITLVAGDQYYLILKNVSGDPVNNHASFSYRGAADSHDGAPNSLTSFQAGYTADGFTTDTLGTNATRMGPCGLVYSSGLKSSFPYVGSAAAAGNTNDRGNRLSFVENIKAFGHTSLATSALSAFEINQGASNIASKTATRHAKARTGNGIYGPTELTKATDYDFVMTYASSTSTGVVYDMGVAEGSVPTDLKTDIIASYVNGATPGSYTVDTSKVLSMIIYIDDLVSAAGGGGTYNIGNMRGGFSN